MLAQRHKLYMRIVHLFDITDELVGELPIGKIVPLQRTPPRPRVYFVGKHGTLIGRCTRFTLLPLLIVPFIMVHIIGARCRIGLFLRVERIGICLHDAWTAPLRLDGIFINFALTDPLDKRLPDLPIVDAVHRMDQYIPVIKCTDDADRLGIRRPNRKADARPTVLLHKMCTEHFLCMIICPLMKEVQIKLT